MVRGRRLFGMMLAAVVVVLGMDDYGIPAEGDIQDYATEEEIRGHIYDPADGLIQHRHIFLGVYDLTRPHCLAPLHQTYFTMGTLKHADLDLVDVGRVPKQAIPGILEEAKAQVDCVSVLYLPRGSTPASAVMSPDDLDLEAKYMEWAGNMLNVPLSLKNANTTNEIAVYWLGEGKIGRRRHKVGTVEPGDQMDIRSYVGHIFYARDARSDELLDYAMVEQGGVMELGKAMTPECSGEGGKCDDLETTMLRFAYKNWFRNRMAFNGIQPFRVQQLTDTGFERHRLPDSIYGPIKEFWDKHQQEAQMEHLVGPAVNQLDVPTYLLDYPDKEQLYSQVKPMLQEWSGKELFPTSCYGIRKYVQGSRLLMHVDTLDTHVVSGIINVAQNTREDWPLLIADHQGKLHNITMEPGDIVFYESSKLLHGRPTPLQGDYYANIFIHYSFPEWNPLPL